MLLYVDVLKVRCWLFSMHFFLLFNFVSVIFYVYLLIIILFYSVPFSLSKIALSYP